MTEITITHRTADGREFADIEQAQAHANLLAHIESFLDQHGVGESRRGRLRTMLVDWTAQVRTTDMSKPALDKHGRAQEAGK